MHGMYRSITAKNVAHLENTVPKLRSNPKLICSNDDGDIAIILSQGAEKNFRLELLHREFHNRDIIMYAFEFDQEQQIDKLLPTYMKMMETLTEFTKYKGNRYEDYMDRQYYIRSMKGHSPYGSQRYPAAPSFYLPAQCKRSPLREMNRMGRTIQKLIRKAQKAEQATADEQQQQQQAITARQERWQQQEHRLTTVHEKVQAVAVDTQRRKLMHQLIDAHPELTVEEVFHRVDEAHPLT